ncbi:MAG: IMP cyclohydrolase [Clostridia bacterium]|nr:IMP cyclohydrolase [Clostridia bacterium]
MNVYTAHGISDLIKGNPYVGRGIIIGKSEDGNSAVVAYFIMGRSANSRNRVFVKRCGDVFTEPFDESKVVDPSLIIYRAVTQSDNRLIVTNGDHTDTIFDGLKSGKSFAEALKTRKFEPDAPNFTPRISGIVNFTNGDFDYEMSILKSADEKGSACDRFTFSYSPIAGAGHFIHTYITDGDPLPTFVGEPERVKIPNDIKSFAEEIWNALDGENKISLFVRFIDLKTGKQDDILINKNGK